MTTYKSLLKEVRSIKKLASQEYKAKLISLLESEDMGSINQALSLNEALGILTDQEVGDILIPKVIDGNENVKEQWEQDGLGWFLLEKFPNHSMWKNLEYLFLRENNLTSLPSSIGNLTNLEHLYSWENNLTSLPKEIGNLKNLKVLYLDNNNLSSLPSSIGNLKNLKVLVLDNNNLSSLPKEIGNLKYLYGLGLSNNNLSSLPKEIGNLKNLKKLRLDGNKLTIEDVPPNLRPITKI